MYERLIPINTKKYSYGTYRIDKDQIHFRIDRINLHGGVIFSGTIIDEYTLQLHSFSEINNKEFDDIFHFAPIEQATEDEAKNTYSTD